MGKKIKLSSLHSNMEKPDARRHKLSGIVGRDVYFKLVHVQLNGAFSHVADSSCCKYGSLQFAIGVSLELPVASESVPVNLLGVSLEIPPLHSENSHMCLPFSQTHPSPSHFINVQSRLLFIL
jgi:hypothetical protein